MLLFVKQRFVNQILAGEKRCEIRYGNRYRNVKPGKALSINGRFRIIVERVEVHTRASLLAADLVSANDLTDCYGLTDGPFQVFFFSPPPAAAPPHRAA